MGERGFPLGPHTRGPQLRTELPSPIPGPLCFSSLPQTHPVEPCSPANPLVFPQTGFTLYTTFPAQKSSPRSRCARRSSPGGGKPSSPVTLSPEPRKKRELTLVGIVRVAWTQCPRRPRASSSTAGGARSGTSTASRRPREGRVQQASTADRSRWICQVLVGTATASPGVHRTTGSPKPTCARRLRTAPARRAPQHGRRSQAAGRARSRSKKATRGPPGILTPAQAEALG